MIRFLVKPLAPIGLSLLLLMPALASDFEFALKVDLDDRRDSANEKLGLEDSPVSTKKGSVATTETLEIPTVKKSPPRAVAELTRGKAVRVSWHAENTSKTEEFKDVLVHFFVVKEEKTGQAEIPKLTEDVTYEGALTMDFKSKDDADWQWVLKIREPGSYLLRVETIGMEKQHGHEHYAALDLVVRDAPTGAAE